MLTVKRDGRAKTVPVDVVDIDHPGSVMTARWR
jgi:hypothetical protein